MSGKDLIKTLYLRNSVTRPKLQYLAKEAAQKERNMELNPYSSSSKSRKNLKRVGYNMHSCFNEQGYAFLYICCSIVIFCFLLFINWPYSWLDINKASKA